MGERRERDRREREPVVGRAGRRHRPVQRQQCPEEAT
jgi:hypothetical protein